MTQLKTANLKLSKTIYGLRPFTGTWWKKLPLAAILAETDDLKQIAEGPFFTSGSPSVEGKAYLFLLFAPKQIVFSAATLTVLYK